MLFSVHRLTIYNGVLVDDRTRGRAGGPTTVCDLRLIDWEEGNYRVSDKPYPRGEIVIGECYYFTHFSNHYSF